MKTLIAGDRELLKEYKYFACDYCGWAGKAEKKEYSCSLDSYNENHYYVSCPTCGKTAREVNSKTPLFDKLLEIERRNTDAQGITGR